jgi:hypothetical protein
VATPATHEDEKFLYLAGAPYMFYCHLIGGSSLDVVGNLDSIVLSIQEATLEIYCDGSYNPNSKQGSNAGCSLTMFGLYRQEQDQHLVGWMEIVPSRALYYCDASVPAAMALSAL